LEVAATQKLVRLRGLIPETK